MILAAGTFPVADYRKPITAAVKLAVMIRQGCKATDGVPFSIEDALKGQIQFDHDPALVTRPFDTEAGDFIPPQLEPAKIVARRVGEHLGKTTGRKEGAERTVTTKGSDVGNAALDRRVQRRNAVHRYRLAVKAYGQKIADGMYPDMAALLKRAERKTRKIKGRGFEKQKRPMRRRA
jgi:hypothetical protein